MSAQMTGASYIQMTAGSAGAAGTGAYTIAALMQPGVGNAGVSTLLTGTTRRRTLLIDSGKIFAENTFTGFGPTTQNVFQVYIQSKPAGAGQTITYEIWTYAADGSGVMTSGGTDTAGDGAAIDQIRFGQAANAANGLYSVLGIWNRQLTVPERQSLKTNLLSVWAGLNPAELIHTKDWNGTTGITTAVGTSTFVGVTGTATVGADPVGFDFTIGVPGVTPFGIATSVALGSPTVSPVIDVTPVGISVPVQLGFTSAGEAPMNTVIKMPNLLLRVRDYVATHPIVTAMNPDGIAPTLNGFEDGMRWIRVSPAPGRRIVKSRLEARLITFNCYAEDYDSTRDLAEAALAAVLSMRGKYTDLVVTETDVSVTPYDLTDQLDGKYRFVFDVEIYFRPA